MAFNKSALLGTTIIAGTLALVAAAPSAAWAQSNTQTTTQSQGSPPPTADSQGQAPAQLPVQGVDSEDSNEVQELVVTGSRIRRNEYTSPAAISVITSEQASLEGLVDTSTLLQSSSVASGSFQVNNQLTGFVTEGGGGVDTISLRGLGANRTLVLLNGRRLGPAGTRGQVQAVDLNTIPQSIIDRIEILKDGASSVYGSDAIAGVVNIITKQDFDGLELDADLNFAEEGAGATQRYSAAYGKTFERGYFNVAADYFRRNPLRRGDRDDTSCAADYLFNPTTGERVDFGTVNSDDFYKCYNLGNNYASVLNAAGASLGNFQLRRPGVNYPALGTTTSPGGTATGFALDPSLVRAGRNGYPETFPYFNTETPLFDRATVVSPVERYTLAFNGGFDLTSNIEAYTELYYNKRLSEQDGVRQIFPQLRSGSVNARQPNGTVFGTAVTDRVQPVIAITSDSDQEIDYYRLVGGFRGDIPAGIPLIGGWDWDIYGQYAKSEGDYTDEIIYRDRVNAVGDTRDFSATSAAGLTATGLTPAQAAAFLTPCFQNAPTGNLNNPGNVSGYNCSALPGGVPWTSARVLAGNFTPEERAFLFGTETGVTEYIHKYVEGTIAGELFTLPAGPIGAALGFQVREEELDDTPGQQSILGNRWGQTAAGRTAGTDSIKEVFGEFEIPLLRDVFAAESLTLQVSGRYSDYESYGESDTYKVGLNWQITPAYRIRATKGTSFRAPALYEQFLGNQTGFLAQGSVDACIQYEDNSNQNLIANCSGLGIPLDFTGSGSSATVITGGGRGVLVAETAESETLGVIWTPSFADINIAIDYFDITVDDEVRQFGAFNIVNQCYAADNFPDSPFCSLFVRDPATFQITTINNSYVNVASQSNRGIDLNVRYGKEFGFGEFTVDGQFTWQLEDVTELIGGADIEDFLGTTYGVRGPDFTGAVQVRFDRGDFTAFYSTQIIGKGSDTEYFEGDTFTSARYANLPAGIASQLVYYKQFTETQFIHNLSARYVMNDWTVSAGVRNVFDERSPSQSAGQFRQGTAAIGYPTYDLLLGRQGFMSLSKSF